MIDPLDGTTNFLFGFPQFAVSVACEDGAGGLIGVVLDPVRDECFAATRSTAATLNGAEIACSQRPDLGTALVATGFSYDADERARQAEVLRRVLPRVRDIRRAGAAALDLVWAACGRVDAFYERGVKAWDIGAGSVIAQRAGMTVRPLAARDLEPPGVLAAPPALADELWRCVLGAECFAPGLALTPRGAIGGCQARTQNRRCASGTSRFEDTAWRRQACLECQVNSGAEH